MFIATARLAVAHQALFPSFDSLGDWYTAGEAEVFLVENSTQGGRSQYSDRLTPQRACCVTERKFPHLVSVLAMPAGDAPVAEHQNREPMLRSKQI